MGVYWSAVFTIFVVWFVASFVVGTIVALISGIVESFWYGFVYLGIMALGAWALLTIFYFYFV